MKFTSKKELVERIDRERRALEDLLASIPMSRYGEAGVWGDGWSIKDLIAHITEWEQMFLLWFRAGEDGLVPEMPAPGFKWNETPALNQAIWRKHRRRALKRVLAEFAASHQEIRTVVVGLPQAQLLSPGRLAWTGKNSLSTYLAPNTCSHYRAAIRILKRWLRSQP